MLALLKILRPGALGWGRSLAFFALGLAMAGALPPWDMWWLGLFCLAPFLALIRRLSPGQAALGGWLYGLGAGAGMMHWLVWLLATYGDMSWALAFFLVAVMLAVLACYGCLVAVPLNLAPQRWWALLAPFLWAGQEWLRGQLFTGLPWLPLGQVLVPIPPLIQTAEWWGVSGLSALVVLINALLAVAICPQDKTPMPRRAGALALALALAGGAWLWGEARMAQVQTLAEKAPQITVSAIQANIPLNRLWRRSYRATVIGRHLDLSRKAARLNAERPHLILWPESSVPFFFLWEKPYSQAVRDMAAQEKVYLSLGTVGRKQIGSKAWRTVRSYLLGPDGVPLDFYDKAHLVPFGEYVPWDNVLFWIRAIAAVGGDHKPGEVGRVYKAGPAVVGPLICYEAIFPYLGRAHRRAGANLFINQTNDAWVGATAGLEQHFSHLILRAVENRVSCARSALTGISGFIAPDGRVLSQSRGLVEGHFTQRLPLVDMVTPFTRHGDLLGPVGLGVLILTWAWGMISRRRSQPEPESQV